MIQICSQARDREPRRNGIWRNIPSAHEDPRALHQCINTKASKEKMSENNSISDETVTTKDITKYIHNQTMIVQVLVAIFFFINSLLIFTFTRKEAFYANARYILFAHTLVCDCTFLLLSDLLLLLRLFRISMPAGLCVVACIASIVLFIATPLTLTAMSVERYVAICMPLRHAELSTPHRALCCIFIIQVLSLMQSIIVTINFVAAAPLSFYATATVCSVEMLVVYSWQSHVRSAITQFYFLVMSTTIIFTYIKIMKVTKVASGHRKNVTSKGLKTVLLHGFQLLLCLIQLWTPSIETAVLYISFDVFVNVKFFDYVVFILTPRCLIPLIYGLRDEQFYCALKHYTLCGLHNKIIPVILDW